MNIGKGITKSIHTPLRCGGRNPSSPSSPCLLSDGWCLAPRLCCSPWNSCARNLGREAVRVRRKQEQKGGWGLELECSSARSRNEEWPSSGSAPLWNQDVPPAEDDRSLVRLPGAFTRAQMHKFASDSRECMVALSPG